MAAVAAVRHDLFPSPHLVPSLLSSPSFLPLSLSIPTFSPFLHHFYNLPSSQERAGLEAEFDSDDSVVETPPSEREEGEGDEDDEERDEGDEESHRRLRGCIQQ